MLNSIDSPLTGFLETSFGKMFYRYYGDKSSPVTICCNGFLMDMDSWERILPAIIERTDVLLLDFIGQGETDSSQKILPSVHENAEYIIKIVHALEINQLPLYLLGISSGGLVGLELAKHHPTFLSKLILMGTPIDYPYVMKYMNACQIELLKNNQMSLFLDLLYGIIYGNNFLESITPRIEELQERFLQKFSGKDMLLYYYALKHQEYLISISEKSLKKIDTPILYIYGEEDILSLHSSIKQRKQMLPQAKFVSIPDSGHFPIVEKQKDFFATIDRFL